MGEKNYITIIIMIIVETSSIMANLLKDKDAKLRV